MMPSWTPSVFPAPAPLMSAPATDAASPLCGADAVAAPPSDKTTPSSAAPVSTGSVFSAGALTSEGSSAFAASALFSAAGVSAACASSAVFCCASACSAICSFPPALFSILCTASADTSSDMTDTGFENTVVVKMTATRFSARKIRFVFVLFFFFMLLLLSSFP